MQSHNIYIVMYITRFERVSLKIRTAEHEA